MRKKNINTTRPNDSALPLPVDSSDIVGRHPGRAYKKYYQGIVLNLVLIVKHLTFFKKLAPLCMVAHKPE